MASLTLENLILYNVFLEKRISIKKPMITSLTFQDNNAENAINFYVELSDNSNDHTPE
jgi:hypothetical protein